MLKQIERTTLESIARHGFTFLGDNHFRTFRQAKITLNRLVREGFINPVKHDPNMFEMTSLGREVFKNPKVSIELIRQYL